MDNYQLLFSSSSSSSAVPPVFLFGHSFVGGSLPPQFSFHDGPSFGGGFLGLMSTEGGVSEVKDNDHQLDDHRVNPVADESDVKAGKKKGEAKKARRQRFAFQTRSQVDLLDDGYRWRKYGQKAIKNKFPRSYYKCTYQGCNVKKQVQRLLGDEEVVVTTYEGVHSHPIDKPKENFEHILSQMHIYHP
ncbi:hypothetical protein MLD38_022731 [Melastoma candidum]|uniref:Uncharacterized protein n=1 Tax=Melastoma candidum TaxID=119954 RepID=A0ACB9QKB0_9MYRT|nr:hypothetical protein MLD38_022731 [Melastoma candidum]